MLPLVLNEKSVHRFKYWNQGIQQGMRYDHQFYRLSRTFAIEDRLTAYNLAGELSDNGIITCVTCSPQEYSVWVNLQSLMAPASQEFVECGVPA